MAVTEFTFTTDPTAAEAPTAPAVDARPENVPEEYWNAETKSVDTDKLLAALAAKEAPKEAEEVSEDAAEGVAAEAGVDIAAVEQAFAETGEVPADVYEKMAKVGIDKSVVDEFVSLRKAQAEALQAEILNSVGGGDTVQKMIEWAGQNWTEAQANAFNAATVSKDRAQIEMALGGLKVAYEKANPTAAPRPSLVKPTAAAPSNGDTYASTAAFLADIRDPRYHKDPAFRDAVAAKRSRSNI